MNAPWRISFMRKDSPLNAVFAIIVFAIYFISLAPSVSGGDSGDLLTAICNSGVPHPPGYPLYVLLGKLFLPLTVLGVSPAWAINFSSMIYGTFAALLLHLTVTRLTKNKWSGLVASGMFAFSPVVWRYAITSEVFALNNLLTSSLLYFFVLYLESRSFRHAITIALIFGLGMSNHHTLLFLGIPIFAFMIGDKRAPKSSLWKLLGAFLLGLSPYLYLPWAGAHNLVTSWGQTDTLSGFLFHIFRSEYGTFRLNPFQFEDALWGDLGKILSDLACKELMGVGVLLALLGAWTFSGKKAHPASEEVTRIFFTLCAGSSATYFLVLFIFNQMPSDMPLKIGVHLRFLPLLLIPIYILVGVGVSKLLALLPRGRLPILLSLFLVILQVGLHYQTENQAGNYASYRYAKAHLETLPKKAILLLSGDAAYYPINYLQACEHYRPDISVIGRGLMKGPWMVRHIREQFSDVVVPDEARYNNDDRSPALGGFSLKDFLDANYGRVPIYISNYDKLESTEWEKFYTTWPTGLSSIILRREDRKLNQDRLLKESSEILESLNFSDLSSFPRESWENIYFRSYKETYSRLAMNLAVTSGEASDSGRFYLDLADHYFGEYFKDNPFPAPQAIKQRAIIKKMRSELH